MAKTTNIIPNKKVCAKMLISLLLALFNLETIISQSTSPPPPRVPTSDHWTSCDSFLNNTVFDPESVLDVDWRIFYFWNPERETSYNIRFSRPSKMLLDRFRVGLGTEIKPPVNWTDAELFMESSIEFSGLYLKTNVSGLYRIIPAAAFEFTSIPMLIFGLKVVKPGYLGIANCKFRLCYGLAPVDKMPEHDKLEEAAHSLGFYNEYNRSYTLNAPGPNIEPEHDRDHGDDDDEDLDVDIDPNRLDLF